MLPLSWSFVCETGWSFRKSLGFKDISLVNSISKHHLLIKGMLSVNCLKLSDSGARNSVQNQMKRQKVKGFFERSLSLENIMFWQKDCASVNFTAIRIGNNLETFIHGKAKTEKKRLDKNWESLGLLGVGQLLGVLVWEQPPPQTPLQSKAAWKERSSLAGSSLQLSGA